MENETDLFTTADLTVVMHLQCKGIKPINHTEENGRARLHYLRDYKLEAELRNHMARCSECGVAFSEVGEAYAKAKRMLLDGDLGDGKQENERREEERDEETISSS